MKTIIRLLFVVFFFPVIFMNTGCKKDEPVTPTEVLPKISFTPNHNIEVPWNGTLIFSWNAEDVKSCCIIRGANDTLSRKLSGFVTLDSLTITTTLTLFYVSLNGKLSEQSITITVQGGPPPPVPTITVNAVPIRVANGESSLITIVTTDADSIVSDLLNVHGPGSFPTPLLTSTITYHFTAYGKGGVASTSITITVDPPIPTPLMDVVVMHPWSEVSGVLSCDGNDPWIPLTIGQEELDIKNVFKKDGTWKSYRYGILVNWGTFSINEVDSTMTGYAGNNKFRVCNPTTITLRHQELSIGCPGDIGWTDRTQNPTTL